MRASFLAAALVTCFFVMAGPCLAAERRPLDKEFLRGFMAGKYQLIGRKPDSRATYTGDVVLRERLGALQVIRTIAGQTTKATMKFTTIAGADKIPVARVRFTLAGVKCEATYMWSTDADNYPRFTGWVYRTDHRTKSPGLEALFPVH